MKEGNYSHPSVNIGIGGDLFELHQVGPYLLQEPLGCGNYGKVRRAVHKTTRQEYAIKAVLNYGATLDMPRNIDIRREMSIQQALSHENIIRLYDVIVCTSHVYLVLEYACHGDFFRLISKRGRLSEYLAQTYFKQLVHAVQYCHDNGVYHRDLKPENLLLGKNGQLKLTDFGFSAMKDHGPPLLKTNCGSPHYCAPEVWNGTQENYDGRKSDAFSAGVVLFVLLTGTQPFYDDDEEKLLRKVNRCKVVYPDYLSHNAKDVLQKLLVKNPADRCSLDMLQFHPWLSHGEEEKIHANISISSPTYVLPKKKTVTVNNKAKPTKETATTRDTRQVREVRAYDEPITFAARALMRVF